MSRKKRMQSAREMKDKRAKRMAIGGAVLLVAVLAFEVPKMMKHGGSSSATPPAATTTTDATGATTPPVTPPGTAGAAVTPTASTKLPNSDVAPQRAKSQLFSFNHFAGKDPFAQQVSDGSALPTPSPSGATPAPAPTAVTAASVKTSGSAGRQSPASRQRTLAVAGAVKLQVNGRVETVRVGGSFPAANPLFKLVTVTRAGIRIGIANGSYTSGAHTVSLQPGRSLTLVDTADGIHYRLRLLSVS